MIQSNDVKKEIYISMEQKIFLKEKEFPMPVKKIKPTDLEYLDASEIEAYLRSIEVIRPWEVIETSKGAIAGVSALSIVSVKKMPKEEKDRTGTFFNFIQYKFSCDIKNGKVGKTTLANFTTYVKDAYSYSLPAFILESLKKKDKARAKQYAAEFKAELSKLYTKKITHDKKELEKFKAEVVGTTAESKVSLSKIK